MFCFLSIHIFKQKLVADVEFWHHSLHDILIYICLTKWSKERNSFFYEDGDNPLKLQEELTKLYSKLVSAHCNMTQPGCQGTTDTWKNYFSMITAALTKPGHCVLSRRAKCPCFHPYTLQSRLWPVWFKVAFPPCDEAETGRVEVFNGYIVCQHQSFQSSWLFPSSEGT